MALTFKVYKLDQEADRFVEKRYLQLKKICQKLSYGGRSVHIVNELLRIIFNTKDAEGEIDNPRRLLVCVQTKFHVCNDLAKSCKISMQDLLRHASHKVFGCITQLVMMHPEIIQIVDSYIQ